MTEPVENKVEKNPEVVEKAARRRFTGEYKQRIVTEIQQCGQSGEIGSAKRLNCPATKFPEEPFYAP